MRAGEGVIVLVAAADWRIEPLSQLACVVNRAADHHARAVEDHREFSVRQQARGLCNRLFPA